MSELELKDNEGKGREPNVRDISDGQRIIVRGTG